MSHHCLTASSWCGSWPWWVQQLITFTSVSVIDQEIYDAVFIPRLVSELFGEIPLLSSQKHNIRFLFIIIIFFTYCFTTVWVAWTCRWRRQKLTAVAWLKTDTLINRRGEIQHKLHWSTNPNVWYHRCWGPSWTEDACGSPTWSLDGGSWAKSMTFDGKHTFNMNTNMRLLKNSAVYWEGPLIKIT